MAKTGNGVIATSGGTIDFPNPDGALHASFEELISVAPDGTCHSVDHGPGRHEEFNL